MKKSCNFTYRGINKEFKGIYNIKPILLNNELKGYVLDFIDKVDAIKNYNKISNDHRIFLENIIGTSYSINKAKEEALMASKTSSTVLITGESGTGKELFARAIHNHSKRAGNPFIAINCAAIPDNLLESELFGYEEGAFTGAKKGGSLGKFELADKGTIFLDEIGDMSLHLQAKLLRVLQEKEVDKIGAKHNVSKM
ncbi:AAA domain family protein [[Clostridium] sordellii ATCC 9714]|nr:AAA domain family protein [[Clostridium] sordellii ATCC 9714] [Paeniclostridium sordellii ATCC 9714]